MEQRPVPATPGVDDIRAFLRIVQDGSFSKAALALGVPKATLSRRMAQLERDLGVALLVRTTRSVQVTEAGRAFLPDAAAALAALEDAAARVREEGGVPRGRLRLALEPELGRAVIAPLLAEFALAHPQVELEVELTARRVDVVHEGFDLALRTAAADEPALAVRRLGALRCGLFASPDYLARRGRPRYAHELSEHAALQVADGAPPGRWTLWDGARTLEVAVTPRVRANDHQLLCAAAVAGLGVALCAEAVAAPAVAAGRLERVLPEWGGPELPLHAVCPAPRFLAPKVRALIEHLAARLASAAPEGEMP